MKDLVLRMFVVMSSVAAAVAACTLAPGDFVWRDLWGLLTNVRDDLILGSLWPQEGNVLVYDVNVLSEKKVFWSEMEITFREIAEA